MMLEIKQDILLTVELILTLLLLISIYNQFNLLRGNKNTQKEPLIRETIEIKNEVPPVKPRNYYIYRELQKFSRKHKYRAFMVELSAHAHQPPFLISCKEQTVFHPDAVKVRDITTEYLNKYINTVDRVTMVLNSAYGTINIYIGELPENPNLDNAKVTEHRKGNFTIIKLY